MKDEDKLKIQSCLKAFKENLPDENHIFWSNLVETKVFALKSQVKLIADKKKPKERAEKLVKDLQRSGPDTINNLMTCLQTSNLHSLHDEIKKMVYQSEDRPYDEYDAARSRLRVYPMESKYRGLLLYVNYKTFPPESGLSERKATGDVTNICTVFKQYIGFKIDYKENLTVEESIEYLESFCHHDCLDEVDSLVVILASHGSPKGMFCSDGAILELSRVFDIFSPDKCPKMKIKPKLFLISGCRGGNIIGSRGLQNNEKRMTPETGTSYPARNDYSLPAPNSSHDDEQIQSTHVPSAEFYPQYDNVFVGYSSFNEHVSLRSEANGSVYLLLIAEVLHEQATKNTVVQILNEVNRRLKLETNDQQASTSWQCTSAEWYFHPKGNQNQFQPLS